MASAFEYFRDESLNSNTPITDSSQSQAAQVTNQPIRGTIGGPIKKTGPFLCSFRWTAFRTSEHCRRAKLFAQPAAIQALLAPRMATYQVGRDQNVYMFKLIFA